VAYKKFAAAATALAFKINLNSTSPLGEIVAKKKLTP
jgi:hypothetical protein